MATAETPPPSCSSSSSRQQQQQHSAAVCKPRPLMLKDYLREDQNSDSFSRRFTTPPTSRWGATTSSANTVRYLLTLELNNSTSTTTNNIDNRRSIGGKAHNAAGCSGGGGGSNNNPLVRLSAMINALKMLRFSNSSSSSSGSRAALTPGSTSRKQQGGMVGLPRSLSKRLRRSFWKKCGDRGHNRITAPCSELASRRVLVRDIVRRASVDDDRMGWVHKATAAAAAAGTTTTTPTTSAIPATLPLPSSSPLKAKLHHSGPATTTSTAGSSPARPSCSTSIGASSWSELDSDSSSRSGSESVGSSSSPVPEFAEPVVKPAAASLLSGERKRAVFDDRHDVENNGVSGSTDRRSFVGGGGGREVEVPTPTPAPTPTGHRYSPEVQGTDGNGDGGMSFTCVQYEEKDQLSPVAVVDFPSSSSDDDDGSTSQSDGTQSTVGADEEDAEEAAAAAAGAFHQRLANIERVKHRLMWKIQKFETLVDLVDPADLTDADTAESVVDGDVNGDEYGCDGVEEEEEEEDEEAGTTICMEGRVDGQARELLDRLKASAAAGNGCWGVWWDHEALLMDLFIQGLWEHEERARATTTSSSASRCLGDDDDGSRRSVEDDLLNAARDWLQATPMRRRRGVAKVEVGTKAELIKELDRNGPWGTRCFDVEEADVVAGIADGFLDALLAEMLFDMLMTTKTTLVW